MRRKSRHFCECLVWISFLKNIYLIANLFLMVKKFYEMLPMKIFQKNFQTGVLFLFEPEAVKENEIVGCKLKENNTKIRSTAFNR